jgi:hypothetical protein
MVNFYGSKVAGRLDTDKEKKAEPVANKNDINQQKSESAEDVPQDN